MAEDLTKWIYAVGPSAKFERYGYNPLTCTLNIEWRDGSAVEIRGVTASQFVRMTECRSKTEFIRRNFGEHHVPEEFRERTSQKYRSGVGRDWQQQP